jgi:methyl-accepting chemotaxis protein
MTFSFLRHGSLVALAFVFLAPAPATAQLQTKVGGQNSVESLTAQEQEMLAVGHDFAKKCGEVLEKWIAAKETTQEKLFSSLYYPVPRTDPPKFTTDWDRLADRDIQAIEEAVLAKSSVMIYAVMVDKYGYLPTHNARYSQPLTGNPAVDLVNNRTKRIFNDRTGLLSAKNKASFLIQRYQRDTGETMADLSVPVMVAGSHWGAVRLGYRALDAASQAVPIPASGQRSR